MSELTGFSTMLTKYFSDYVCNYQPYKGGAWCYEDGCLYAGMEMLYRTSGEQLWLDQLIRLVDKQISDTGEIYGYRPSEFNIDHIKSGSALLFLHTVTGEKKYLDATAPLMLQLEHHPRTRSGVYWHKLVYPWQVWLDGLYMVAPFRLEFALKHKQPSMVKDVVEQLTTALKNTLDSDTGLYSHAFDESKLQAWSCIDTGRSPAYWARSMGWLAMCLVDVAELLGSQEFRPLERSTRRFLQKISEYRVNDGLWLQVIDMPDLPDNYEETSASAMFCYALYKGARMGLCAKPDNLVDTLLARSLRQRSGGGYEMFDICSMAGLGGFEGSYRDGTPEYYLSEPRISDDPKGVGPLMMCVAEAGVFATLT